MCGEEEESPELEQQLTLLVVVEDKQDQEVGQEENQQVGQEEDQE